MRKAYKFIDSLRLHVRGGPGGMGYPKFGGVGGKGGDIYVEAVEGQTLKQTLTAQAEKRWKAGEGENSRKFQILGVAGKDVIIPSPTGVAVRLDTENILGELNEVGDKVLVARGGAGGSPSNGFSGQKGQAQNISLELKLIAAAGLVGFPNAGKSTFLAAISRARPKIASYPFTTIQPNIGIAEFPDKRQISIADLPGLVEGAWANMGMGHKFLRHVERTKLLLIIVDINGFRLSAKHQYRTPLENVVLLNRELELYSEDLLEKPCILIINKMDCAGSEEKLKKLLQDYKNIKEVGMEFPDEMQPRRLLTFDDIIPCSAKTNAESVDYIKNRLRQLLDFHDDVERNQLNVELIVREKVKNKLVEKSKRLV